ncbi:flagellar biosynthesis repressor FlbT [Jannaschia donghaensis]|uniref:Flagellar biosynthesis repressor FlbT n=1 Tax=Jannaschia donghaensis TaxID=420998 RepID=A0A0M6YIK5_9RHOB|nr:flagellar biosynthesis repressor FlbT [Jannaschia donghaensis]CTQ49107.1 flagellar biosynthesis repressor FlbT [Jannaschia donghaensis]
MAGLMLKFPSGDRIVVNGAVMENVGRGARLRLLTPDTQLLRLRDAIDPASATTPVGRLTHLVQLMLIGETSPQAALPEALASLTALRSAFIDREDRACVDQIVSYLQETQFYQALRTLGRLRRREAELLGAPVR